MRKWPAHLPAFLWGVSTSSHQVEGGNDNDWTRWEQAGRVAGGERSGKASHHWQRFDEDYELFDRLHINAYRFSLEWSRIEPDPGRFDDDALNRYRTMIQRMVDRGWTPVMTLQHFTLPRWQADAGGIFAPGLIADFRRYLDRVLDAVGDLVDLYITVNEPMVWAVMSHVTGDWPPGNTSIRLGLAAGDRLARLHRTLYRHLKRQKPEALVGVAHHFIAFQPLTSRVRDRIDTRVADWLFHWRFLRKVRGHQDFIGVNYYSRQWIHCAGGLRPLMAREGVPTTDMGWEIYPVGLEEWLVRLKRFDRPLIVTENGIATGDDAVRERFIRDHLDAIARAQRRGAPVRGYFYWSGLDNFEWAEGFRPRFGLIEVDYATGERTPRPSARAFGQWIAQNRGSYPIIEPSEWESTALDL